MCRHIIATNLRVFAKSGYLLLCLLVPMPNSIYDCEVTMKRLILNCQAPMYAQAMLAAALLEEIAYCAMGLSIFRIALAKKCNPLFHQ